MPAALVPALVAVGLSATMASVVSYGVFTVALIGTQYLLNRLSNKKRKGDPQVTSFVVRQALAYRTRGYGRNRLAGTMFTETAQPLGNLWMGIVHCEGPVALVERWLFNDTDSGIPAGSFSHSNLAFPWISYLGVETHTGTVPEIPFAALGGYRLDGLCASVIVCAQPSNPSHFFQYFWPNGVPALNVVAQCCRVFDPRDVTQDWNNRNSWQWSPNLGLCILDYLTFGWTDVNGKFVRRGLGIPHNQIDLGLFVAFANICDELVDTLFPDESPTPVLPLQQRPRYQFHGMYSMDERPADVLARMLIIGDATLYTTAEGKVGIRGGKWVDPTVTITEKMIKSYKYDQGNDKMVAFNQLRIKYTSPVLNYKGVEGGTYDDFDNQDINGVIGREFDVTGSHSYSQARRLAKIYNAKENPEHKYENLVCDLGGLACIDQEFITINHPTLGINTSFFVTGFSLDTANMVCILSAVSVDVSAYHWNAEVEDKTPPNAAGTVVVDTERPGIVEHWALGNDFDMGLASDADIVNWDFGLASDSSQIHTDLGLESA